MKGNTLSEDDIIKLQKTIFYGEKVKIMKSGKKKKRMIS
jgi:hypothetical protein